MAPRDVVPEGVVDQIVDHLGEQRPITEHGNWRQILLYGQRLVRDLFGAAREAFEDELVESRELSIFGWD
jgi:hypothetical protein